MRPERLRCAVVLRVAEDSCEVSDAARTRSVRFAPQIPSPRVERVSPGHLVAIATAADGDEVVVWRWYDAVVLADLADDSVTLWEPAHGEVVARKRPESARFAPGTRAYASAGLPGADWWVAGPVVAGPADARVELDEVDGLYTQCGFWAAAFGRAD